MACSSDFTATLALYAMCNRQSHNETRHHLDTFFHIIQPLWGQSKSGFVCFPRKGSVVEDLILCNKQSTFLKVLRHDDDMTLLYSVVTAELSYCHSDNINVTRMTGYLHKCPNKCHHWHDVFPILRMICNTWPASPIQFPKCYVVQTV